MEAPSDKGPSLHLALSACTGSRQNSSNNASFLSHSEGNPTEQLLNSADSPPYPELLLVAFAALLGAWHSSQVERDLLNGCPPSGPAAGKGGEPPGSSPSSHCKWGLGDVTGCSSTWPYPKPGPVRPEAAELF